MTVLEEWALSPWTTDFVRLGADARFIPHVRVFADDARPARCWAHHPNCDETDCVIAWAHGCQNEGTGRAGLCSYHEREVIGPC